MTSKLNPTFQCVFHKLFLEGMHQFFAQFTAFWLTFFVEIENSLVAFFHFCCTFRGEHTSTMDHDLPRSCLYFVLFLVLLNSMLSITLAVGFINLRANAEPETKKFSIEYLDQIIDNIRHNEDKAIFVNEVGSAVKDVLMTGVPHAANAFVAGTANSLIPYDVFSIADFLVTYNFTEPATLFSQTMESASKSFMLNPDYAEGAEVISAIGAVSKIVSTIKPLSGNSGIPDATEYSLLGQSVLRLPNAFYQALENDDVWRRVAGDCAILSERLYFTNWEGTYQTPYGDTGYFNFNEGMREVLSEVHEVCQTLALSPALTPSS